MSGSPLLKIFQFPHFTLHTFVISFVIVNDEEKFRGDKLSFTSKWGQCSHYASDQVNKIAISKPRSNNLKLVLQQLFLWPTFCTFLSSPFSRESLAFFPEQFLITELCWYALLHPVPAPSHHCRECSLLAVGHNLSYHIYCWTEVTSSWSWRGSLLQVDRAHSIHSDPENK